MEDQLRFAVCYWHSFTWPGGDAFGGETFHRPWMHRRTRWRARGMKADVAFEMFRPARRAVLLLPRPRHRAGRRLARRIEPERAGDRRDLRQEDGDVEGAAPLGHRQPLLQPPLHGGRGDQSRSGGLRLRRGAGEERARADPRARRRQLRAVGRPRGLRDAAQHRHEARARPARPLPQHGGRAQAQDRLQGHRS